MKGFDLHFHTQTKEDAQPEISGPVAAAQARRARALSQGSNTVEEEIPLA